MDAVSKLFTEDCMFCQVLEIMRRVVYFFDAVRRSLISNGFTLEFVFSLAHLRNLIFEV